MKIRLRCFTGMRRYAPGGRPDIVLELVENTAVAQLLHQLGVPSEAQPFVAVNGRRVDTDHRLRDGNEVVVFSQMEGG